MNKTKITFFFLLPAMALLFGGCENAPSENQVLSKFDRAIFDELKKEALLVRKKRGPVHPSLFKKHLQDEIDKRNILRIFIDKNSPCVIGFEMSASGIATDGVLLKIAYDEDPWYPVVSDIAKARKAGDRRIVLYQKIEDDWYLVATSNER